MSVIRSDDVYARVADCLDMTKPMSDKELAMLMKRHKRALFSFTLVERRKILSLTDETVAKRWRPLLIVQEGVLESVLKLASEYVDVFDRKGREVLAFKEDRKGSWIDPIGVSHSLVDMLKKVVEVPHLRELRFMYRPVGIDVVDLFMYTYQDKALLAVKGVAVRVTVRQVKRASLWKV